MLSRDASQSRASCVTNLAISPDPLDMNSYVSVLQDRPTPPHRNSPVLRGSEEVGKIVSNAIS